ncbi:MAG: LuxR C-terminal-related transcriptional regulator [Gaiella sp.]|nr:LuxR C-terminal-related transcriptional regulator [Gaiella sp.]
MAGRPDTAIVGREAELEALDRFIARDGPALLEIEGEPGIGKTVLWEEGVRRAHEAGALVLASRPVEIETAVAYGALAAVVEPALELANGSVPVPRRRALEGALRLRELPVSSLDETAVALGATSVLRAVARQRPVVVAVEDVQWLDASSRVALTYALRNLRPGDDARVLVTRRLGDGARLELGGTPLSLASELLQPGPLSPGALHRIISRRLRASLSRPKLVRVHAASRGNPFHALELARVLGDATTAELAVAIPPSLGDALRARIAALSDATRALLLAVAAAGEPTPELLAGVVAPDDVAEPLGEALEEGVLVIEGTSVRFSHPLLASTVYGDASELARRSIHARLADVAGTPEARARQLALGGSGPDETIAAALSQAAASTSRRGAQSAAAALYEQAASVTPAGNDHARLRRLLRAARAHFESGETDRARALLERVGQATGPIRFEALCALGTLLDETVGGDVSLALFEEALAADDPAARAQAHRGLAQSLVYVGDLERALRHADAAVVEAQRLRDPTVLVYALAMQALVGKMSGRPDWRTPLERGLALEARLEPPDLDGCPAAFEADTLRLGLELDGARSAYERMLARTTERGDVRTECWCRFGLASVEIAGARWERAAEHAEELADLAAQTGTLRLPALRTTAHLHVLRGDVDAARSLLERIASEAEPAGELHNLRSTLQLEGLLELSLGDAAAALSPLRRAREIAERMAVGEPSMLAFLLDEVEAHSLTGDAASAAAVLMAFDRRCEREPPAWVAPLALRARGLVEAASRDLETARATLADAVATEQGLPLPLERARTRLAHGRVLRRLQHRARARAELSEALARFERLGAPLWAERSREELARVGGRAASTDDLTPTERRIAELVARGRSNREVAASLFVTPKTVESALTRVYRKLGVRSRTELASRLAEAG